MSCKSVYEEVTFGWKLHKECYGCKLAAQVKDISQNQLQDAPVFDERCPRKVNINETETTS
mgnify:CR=1 FL=1